MEWVYSHRMKGFSRCSFRYARTFSAGVYISDSMSVISRIRFSGYPIQSTWWSAS